MNVTARVVYKGGLRSEAEHIRSGERILNDAPIDNNGRGEAFSPTDMVATALATCMLTTMAIQARALNFDLENASAEVVKIMASNPRRIGEVIINVILKKNCDATTQQALEEIALNCPVARSLSGELKQNISFQWI